MFFLQEAIEFQNHRVILQPECDVNSSRSENVCENVLIRVEV